MLKNEKKEEPELKLSKTLTNKINTNKRLFEENFNKILYKINEIMNNIKDIQMKITCEDNILGRIDDYSQVQPTKRQTN